MQYVKQQVKTPRNWQLLKTPPVLGILYQLTTGKKGKKKKRSEMNPKHQGAIASISWALLVSVDTAAHVVWYNDIQASKQISQQ